MKSGLALTAQRQGHELVDVKMLNRELVRSRRGIGDHRRAIGRDLKVREIWEPQQVGITGAIELGPYGAVFERVTVEGFAIELNLCPRGA